MTDEERIDWIEAMLHAGQFAQLDQWLAMIDFAELEPVAIMTMLRQPYSARDRLSRWGRCYRAARQELLDRGLDADGLLVGLAP